MKSYKDIITEVRDVVQVEESKSSKFRKPVEAAAKKVEAMSKQAIKMEDSLGAMYDKLGDSLKAGGGGQEAGQIQDELMDVVDAANALYQAAKKASKELYNIGSRF
jgi:chorismate synthase